MGLDENIRRGVKHSKTPTKHPYAAIQHRVMDSQAYADLSFSAQSLLMVIARQLRKDNNGHLQATFKFCSRYGFRSEHTLQRAIAELISHGFIYRTRSHGANQAWARYAVTWLPVTKSRPDGVELFLHGFVADAWKCWQPSMTNDKNTLPKVQEQSRKKCSFAPHLPTESAGTTPAKTADYELMLPCSSESAQLSHVSEWIAPYLQRLANRGLTGHQCLQTQRTMQ